MSPVRGRNSQHAAVVGETTKYLRPDPDAILDCSGGTYEPYNIMFPVSRTVYKLRDNTVRTLCVNPCNEEWKTSTLDNSKLPEASFTTNHDSYSNHSRALAIPLPLIRCSNMSSAGGVAHRYRGQDGVRQVVAYGDPLPYRRAMRRAHDDRRHRRPARGSTGPSQGHLGHSTGEPRHRGSSTRATNMKIKIKDQQQGPFCSLCRDFYFLP